MSPPTRRSVLTAVGAVVFAAGCLSDAESDRTETPTDSSTTRTTADSPTETTATTTDDPATTGDWISQASNEPDPDHAVTLYNEGSETRTVRVWVVREETGETVFEETRESPPETEYGLYDLARADPDGIEAFAVCGQLVGADATTDAEGESDARDCETLRTNACYGDAHVTTRDDGSLRVIYSVC